MAKFNLIQRKQNGVVAGSPSDYYNQLESSASQVIKKVGSTSFPLARLTVRAQARAKVPTCKPNDACVHQVQHVRIEGTGLAAGTVEDRQAWAKAFMRAVSEFQNLLKAGAVVGYAPTDVATDDGISSLTLNLTGLNGVAAS